MSAAPTDYPTAVLKEAEAAMVSASSGLEYPYADRAGAQAYADVLARYTVSQRLTRSPGGVLVLDSPGEPIPAAVLSDTEPPPVDGAYLASALTDAIGEGRGEHEQGCDRRRARRARTGVRLLCLSRAADRRRPARGRGRGG